MFNSYFILNFIMLDCLKFIDYLIIKNKMILRIKHLNTGQLN
jgi:hypothetical protein